MSLENEKRFSGAGGRSSSILGYNVCCKPAGGGGSNASYLGSCEDIGGSENVDAEHTQADTDRRRQKHMLETRYLKTLTTKILLVADSVRCEHHRSRGGHIIRIAIATAAGWGLSARFGCARRVSEPGLGLPWVCLGFVLGFRPSANPRPTHNGCFVDCY